MIDFNDLIPRAPTKTYPPKTGLIDFNDLIPTTQPVQEKTAFRTPQDLIEPNEADLAIYRRMGLKEYVSPSGKKYPLTQPIEQASGKVYEAPTEYLRTQEVPEVLSEIEKTKPIGLAESIRRGGVGAVTRRLPFVGPSLEAAKNIEIGKAAKRLQGDVYEQMYSVPREQWTMQMIVNPHPSHLRREDEKLITEHFNKLDEESRRDKTFWAKVGSGAMDLAPWMIEFGATGGLSKLGSGATQKFGTKLLSEYAKTKAGQLALRGAGWGVGAAARTTVGLPGRVAEQYTRRRLPEQLTIDEQGQVSFQWPKEKPFTSFAKAWGNVFVEAASEEAGQAISGRLFGEIRGLPFGNKLLTALRKAWTKLSSDNSMMKFWQQMFKKGGYSNIIGEIGEERLATIMHSIAKTEDFGVGEDANVIDRLVAGFTQDVKNFPVEAAVLSIPGATRFALGKATGGIAAPQGPAEPTEPIPTSEEVKPWAEPIERPGEVTRRRRVEILPRKDEILTQIDDAIKNAPEAKDYDSTEKPTVHFEIDGGANIQDNKEALQQFRQRVANLPETELWPKAVTHKVGKKKPIAATKEKIGELIKAPEGWFTDGSILVKGEPPAKAKRAPDWKGTKPVNIDDIIHAPTEPAEFQHYAVSDPSYGQGISDRPIAHIEEPGTAGPLAVFKSGGKYFVYDQDRYNLLRNRYPDAEYGIKDETGLLVAYMGRDNPVAALMGITLDEAEGPGLAEPPVKMQPLPKEAKPKKPAVKMPEHKRTDEGLVVIESDIGEVHIPEGTLTGEYGKDLETIFYYGNFQSETPQPRLKRSLSVGDTVKYKGHTLMIMPQGWRDVTGLSDDAIEAIQTSENAIGLAASWRAAEKRLRKEKEGEPKAPEKPEPLKTYEAEVELPNGEKAAFDYQYVEYPKTGQHEYGFNFHNKTIGAPNTGIIHHSAKATEVDAAGGPIEYARQWAAKRYAEVKGVRPKAKPVAKAEIAIGDTVKIAAKPSTAQLTDAAGKTGKVVDIQMIRGRPSSWAVDIAGEEYIVDDLKDLELAKQFEILNSRGQRYGPVFESREKAQKYLEKRITSAAGRIQFTIQEVPAEEPSLFAPTEKPGLSFEDLIPDVKDIKNVVVDTFRDWPKGIKKVGKDYWTEVMAAAKQLATPYRYKALRQTMLGVFRHKKGTVPPQVVGIELQDVTDALTATHELGHNIDWLLNNKIFPISIKGRFPGVAVGEMTLRNELKKISKVLRPDMWERPKAYIKGHTELMADFISHYILDPEKTMELAPNLTRAFEAKLAAKPDLFEIVSSLQESRYTGPEEPPIAKHIREVFPLPKEFKPLQLAIDMTDKDYVKAAEELGLTAARHYKLLIQRAQKEADRIDELVPNKDRQTDLVVVAEKGSKNPWTGKTREEIYKDVLTAGERKAINLFRAYQEKARQTVNKYLRGADIAEYIKFIEDYFIHAYQTPLTEKYKSAIARWAKRSPQVKKRVLPDLAKAVELGMKPRAKTLSEGLMLWAGINYRVMTNKAFLRILPNITNDDGVSILQKPQDYPSWPTVDYWPIRQNYAVPLPGRGVLLFQGRVAVDPRVKPFIDAMFGRKSFSTPVRIIEGLNAMWKAFELTLFSFFHHQAEFFSAAGSLGPRALPFVGGYYGKRARAFGKKPRLWGLLPAHITTLKAGRELEKVPEFMDDYIAHGGQIGYISTEGINLMERMLKRAADYIEGLVQREPTTPLTGVFAAAYVPVKAAQEAYSFHQSVLWDNVQRAKLVAYYNIVADGAKYSDLTIKQVKETAAKYIADNFGGQEWLNTMFRNRKTRQFWTQLMMSLDWTWSQIKTARWPFAYGGEGKAEKARRALMRKIGRHHWFWYLSAIAGFTIAGSYAMSGKGPWENEKGHKLDIDWTKIWRKLPWNRDWKQRGDYNRRYISLGKAGRELVRWVTSPLRAFGYKLSPVARSTFEQTTGYNVGSDWAEPWAREDMEGYQELYARFKHLMENFKPFAFSGNNAFLAFPSRKGMTHWKATRAYEEIYKAKAIIAMGGIGGKIAKANQILKKDEQKLRAEIEEACKLNNVDPNQTDKEALTEVRRKYYSLFWKATKMPEKKAVSLCNAYANALLELGVTPRGFKQSLRYRIQELPEKSKKLGVQIFHDTAAKKHKSGL